MPMEKRRIYDKIYVDALRTNENETQRWRAYQQEHMVLKDNLRMYQKLPRANILIPMGTKALLPGQLYHTGEVYVSHGSGYFSECSTEQACMIADRRIVLADEMLHKYDRERTLYSDKLEVPFVNEAFASNDDSSMEIIEPYDEQVEDLWRVEHRRRVRENKLREAEERLNKEYGNETLLEKLDEMELLEELEKEMDQLKMPDCDDQLGRLMRGEIHLNNKQRTAHLREDDRQTLPDVDQLTNNGHGELMHPNQNHSTVEEGISKNSNEDMETSNEEDSTDENEDENISAEFSQLLDETKNFSMDEKIKRFNSKLKVVRKCLYQNSITIAEKVDLYQLHDELEEALDFLQPIDNNGRFNDEIESAQKVTLTDEKDSKRKAETRKISFAEHDSIKLIDSRNTVHKNNFATTHKTLFLPIEHSWNRMKSCGALKETIEITCPADIYRMFIQMQLAQSPVETRSILKNKDLVQKESHGSTESLTRNQSANSVERVKQDFSTPIDLLGDVVEHNNERECVSASTALPLEQKRKASRFKQQRK